MTETTLLLVQKRIWKKKKFESKKNQMNSTSLFLSTLSSSTTLVVATVDVVDVTDSTDFCGVGSPVNGTVEAATRPARVRARFFRPKTLVPPIPTGGLKQNWGCLWIYSLNIWNLCKSFLSKYLINHSWNFCAEWNRQRVEVYLDYF